MSPSLCSFLNSPVTSTFFMQNISLSILFSLSMTDQVSHPHKSVDKIIVPYILVFIFSASRKKKTKCSELIASKHSVNLNYPEFLQARNSDLSVTFLNI